MLLLLVDANSKQIQLPVKFEILNALSVCDRHLGLPHTAIDYLLQAIEIGKSAGCNTVEAFVNLSALYIDIKNFHKSLTSSQAAIAEISKLDQRQTSTFDSKLAAIAFYNKGKCQQSLGDQLESIDSFKTAIKHLKKSGLNPDSSLYKEVSFAYLNSLKHYKDQSAAAISDNRDNKPVKDTNKSFKIGEVGRKKTTRPQSSHSNYNNSLSRIYKKSDLSQGKPSTRKSIGVSIAMHESVSPWTVNRGQPTDS